MTSLVHLSVGVHFGFCDNICEVHVNLRHVMYSDTFRVIDMNYKPYPKITDIQSLRNTVINILYECTKNLNTKI